MHVKSISDTAQSSLFAFSALNRRCFHCRHLVGAEPLNEHTGRRKLRCVPLLQIMWISRVCFSGSLTVGAHIWILHAAVGLLAG